VPICARLGTLCIQCSYMTYKVHFESVALFFPLTKEVLRKLFVEIEIFHFIKDVSILHCFQKKTVSVELIYWPAIKPIISVFMVKTLSCWGGCLFFTTKKFSREQISP
jgi:hypothetical protein